MLGLSRALDSLCEITNKTEGGAYSQIDYLPSTQPHYGNPRIFAVDCEMVHTIDDENALARVSVVQCVHLEAMRFPVVIDTFICLKSPVIDYRTFVSGVEPTDVEGLDAMDFDEVRNAIMNVIGAEDYLIGHSLHFDLKVLKLSHIRVIDTASLFRIGPMILSLADAVRHVFGESFRDAGSSHDSVDDARWAGRLACYYVSSFIRSGSPSCSLDRLPNFFSQRLRIHGIPFLDETMTRSLFTSFVIRWVKLRPNGCLIEFLNETECHKAFFSLHTISVGLDKSNYVQQKILLSNSVISVIRFQTMPASVTFKLPVSCMAKLVRCQGSELTRFFKETGAVPRFSKSDCGSPLAQIRIHSSSEASALTACEWFLANHGITLVE